MFLVSVHFLRISWQRWCFSHIVLLLAIRLPLCFRSCWWFCVVLRWMWWRTCQFCLVSRVGYSVTDTDYCALLCVSAYSLLLAFCSVSRSHRLLTDPCTLQSVQVAFLSSFGWKAIQPGFYLLLDGWCFCRLSHTFSVIVPIQWILYYIMHTNVIHRLYISWRDSLHLWPQHVPILQPVVLISSYTCQMTCQVNPTRRYQWPLQPIPAVSTQFEHLLVDCVGPLPRSQAGNGTAGTGIF